MSKRQRCPIVRAMSPAPAWAAQGARIAGFVLLVPVGLLYLSSGLLVPLPWLAGLWALFVAFASYAVVHRREPWRVLAVPVVAVLFWLGAVSLGDAFLGWTA